MFVIVCIVRVCVLLVMYSPDSKAQTATALYHYSLLACSSEVNAIEEFLPAGGRCYCVWLVYFR